MLRGIHMGKNVCSTFLFGSLSHKQGFTLMALSEMRLKGIATNNEAAGWFSFKPFKASKYYSVIYWLGNITQKK